MYKHIFTLLFLSLVACKEDPKSVELNVYSYSSFQSFYGAGNELVKRFEENCQCTVNLKNIGDAGLIVQRLSLGGDVPDVVIGIDQLSRPAAESQLQWRSFNLQGISWQKPVQQKDQVTFVPFNWAPLTFLYNSNKINPASSFKDLLSDKYKNKIILQDPRTSSPGYQFLVWANNSTDKMGLTDFLKKFKANIYKTAPSWTTSYGLFNEFKAPIIFTYLTSLAYHQLENPLTQIKAMSFDVSHPVQIEYIAIPKKCKHCALAEKFVRFLLTRESQELIMNKNYMFPVINGVKFDPLKVKLPALKTNATSDPSDKKQLIKIWKQALQE